MPKDTAPGKPTTRRYSAEEKAAAVRMVRTLRAELGTEHGTIQRVAAQLGYGIESVRSWVRLADIDQGHQPGLSTSDAEKLKVLEQENRELKRANEMAESTGERNGPVTLRSHSIRERFNGSDPHARAEAVGELISWWPTDSASSTHSSPSPCSTSKAADHPCPPTTCTTDASNEPQESRCRTSPNG